MAIDTPARIAVLGAGPVGLEAALYARFLGYDVEIYERGRVAENILRRGHARMFAPFGQCHSTLALAALSAHDSTYQPPGDDELLTGREWAERYLLPLSRTDLLSDHLRLGCEVLAVGKDELLKGDCLPADAPDLNDKTADDLESRGDYDFRLLVRNAAGHEEIHKADAVLDATGVYGNPNWLGQGGVPAVGETALRNEIEYGLPDVLGADRTRYADRHTLVVGSGLSAASTVAALVKLGAESPSTRVTWLTRRETARPVEILEGDPFPERDRIIRMVDEIAHAGSKQVAWHPATFVDAVRRDASGELVTVLSGKMNGELRCDQIVANVGYRPDTGIYRELQIGTGRLDESPTGVTSEPNFYILGAKTGGRTGFSFKDGLAQIREVFVIMGDRASLDLYVNAQRLVQEAH